MGGINVFSHSPSFNLGNSKSSSETSSTEKVTVSGQWDINKLGNLASQKYFYIAAESDDKASAGQIEVETMLKSAGAKYGATTNWDATWSADKFIPSC